jgi:hypothetical protein
VALLLIVNYAKDIEYINELPCDEFYVVEEGETLDSIGFKCCDSYVHDAEDISIRIHPRLIEIEHILKPFSKLGR